MSEDKDKYIPPVHPEIGELLKVSDLQLGQIVWIHKPGRPPASLRFLGVVGVGVAVFGGLTYFVAQIVGDRITDDVGSTLYLYRYLGEDA